MQPPPLFSSVEAAPQPLVQIERRLTGYLLFRHALATFTVVPILVFFFFFFLNWQLYGVGQSSGQGPLRSLIFI